MNKNLSMVNMNLKYLE